MLNLKCVVRLNKDWRSPIEATLIAFVPAAAGVTTRTILGKSELDTISTDAIVRLDTFDKDKLYQIPLECVMMGDG
jgi:hypothetical protein